MAITITNANTQPGLRFDMLFMESLKLEQKLESRADVQPYFTLNVTYRMYAQVDNDRFFESKINTVSMPDYLATAFAKAQMGDSDLLQAIQAIELALAKIVEDQTNLGTASIV